MITKKAIKEKQHNEVEIKLAAELAALRAKVGFFYWEEIVLRGDKNLTKAYKDTFNIE
jgi:hypothetical protein